jgi:ElaB/YqjD/DUF883 family membrane-anchored ribosome-binding protein
MGKLWTPPAVSRELEQVAVEGNAQLAGAVSHLKGRLDYWNRELRKIDARLEMVWFDESAKGIPGVVPCRYHLIRRNDAPSPWSVIPVQNSKGEYVEPDSGVFEMLLRDDMWSESAEQERRKARSRAEAAKAREREREAEERQQEIFERVQAARRAFVSMSRDSPWTQNSAGRRAAKRAA